MGRPAGFPPPVPSTEEPRKDKGACHKRPQKVATIPPMHLGRILAATVFCAPACGPASASAPAPAGEMHSTPLSSAPGPADPVIPLRIPGYELRVLDRGKPVLFNVAGVRAESTLPIFVYVPTSDPGRAAGLLRQAYDGLRRLGLKPEWTAAELQAVLANLDAAIHALEADNPAAPTAEDRGAQAALQPGAR